MTVLSPLCHQLHVSDSDKHPEMTINGVTYPTIDERATLYLKQWFDSEFYNRDYLQTIWIGKVPEPKRPPEFWCKMLFENQGDLI